jgi:hypothetical protein
MRFFGIEVVLGCVLWFIPLAYFAGPVTSASRHFCPQTLLLQIIQWGWVPPQFGNGARSFRLHRALGRSRVRNRIQLGRTRTRLLLIPALFVRPAVIAVPIAVVCASSTGCTGHAKTDGRRQ